MATLIHRASTPVQIGGAPYRAEVWGERRDDRLWQGWIEFVPSSGEGPVLATGGETVQSNLEALTYWATGLEPVYLEGALARATEKASRAA
jgi:hypothetical protein